MGLVLGGGGVRGASWIMGALHALVVETGWDPSTADVVIGTSAGAVVAALTTGGARPWESLQPERADLLRGLLDSTEFRLEPSLRSLGPGSLELAGRGLRDGRVHVAKVVAGLLPEGSISTSPIVGLVRRWAPSGWPSGGRLWIIATDYATGDRVAFGRAGAPAADLADAVAASCAIPGFYRPVAIDGRRFVDGGVQGGGANLDLAAEAALDLVICLNPLSSPVRESGGALGPVRALLHRQLLPQVRLVEGSGASLLLIEPTGRSVGLIGVNPMSRRGLPEVGAATTDEVREQLRRPAVAPLLAVLPAG